MARSPQTLNRQSPGKTFDSIVLGVGGFGSSALFHLAQRGLRTLGIEQFNVAHDRGSSHGETRIIRKAYFEHPDYVPLLQRAYELWRQLEQWAGKTLYRECGLMLAGPSTGQAIHGARLAARQHGVPLESVSPVEAGYRFPGFCVPDGFDVVFEREAGYLFVEECIRAHVRAAVEHGAVLAAEECVRTWSSDGRTVRVVTDRNVYEGSSLIVTAGAWSPSVLSQLGLPLQIVRKVLCWNPVRGDMYNETAGGLAFFFEMPYGTFYGFPSIDGRRVKLAEHSHGDRIDTPETLDRKIHPTDSQSVSRFVRAVMPHLSSTPIQQSVCMYTMTPDGHFLVDRHPESPNVVIGAGFSGHGFKFTSVIGEAFADLVQNGKTNLPIDFLRLDRPSIRKSTAHGQN